ncbi:J domain-containing protein [Nonomuraea basaltis]|uniref:J domain-containing protein n=1 Tax=Nonomuraea basaltis TaxID=2495887 RepID=UPI00110C6D84|nr:J domain-containing protein [Nonomuraea basaltis]TMR93174.1 J domain-containing protein [Nonomuraea basaltis]
MPVRHDGKQPRRDHYTVLGVEKTASAAQITSAYRRLMRLLHPDARLAGPAARERFAEVIHAYAVLRDPARRAAYDAERGRDAPLGGRPVSVRVTHTPDPDLDASARTVRRRLPAHVAAVAAVIVDLSSAVAPLEHALLRVGPARLHPARRDARDMPLLGRPNRTPVVAVKPEGGARAMTRRA